MYFFGNFVARHVRRGFLALGAGAVLVALGGSFQVAQAQNSAAVLLAPQNSGLEIFAEQGFDIEAVHRLILSQTDLTGEIHIDTVSQITYAAYTNADDNNFIVIPEFCSENGKCLGLVFQAFMPGGDFNASFAQLNSLNSERPQGNVFYDSQSSTYVVQKLSTNTAGITVGGMLAEFEIFQGYANAVASYLAQITATTGKVVSNDLVSPETMPAPALSVSLNDTAAADATSMSPKSMAVFEDMRANLAADKIYFDKPSP